jgi:beta-lactamase regulating signal transducer with metallopeptidase domain
MNALWSEVLIGLLLSLPLGLICYRLAASLEGAAGSRADRIWTLALLITLAPLPLAVVTNFVGEHWEPPQIWPTFSGMPVFSSELEEPVGLEPLGRMAESYTLAGVLTLIWVLGASARFVIELIRSWRLHKTIRRTSLASADLIQAILPRATHQGVALDIRQSEQSGSPFLCGVFRPCLVLPPHYSVSQSNLDIVDHELAHARRRDVLTALLMRVLGLVFWFNPAWWACEQRRQVAVEMACDADVLRRKDTERVRSYARALLDTVRTDSGSAPAVGFGVTYKEALKMRLISILSPAPSPKWRRLILGGLGAVSLLVGAAGLQLAQASGRAINAPVFSHVVLEGRFTSGYGLRNIPSGLPESARNHGGVDVAAPLGSPVYSPAPGHVFYVGDNYQGSPAWGHVIGIDHGAGWTTLYAHLGDMHVAVGDQVTAGFVIADVGQTGLSTGPHVHVEVHQNGDRVDPEMYLPGLHPIASQ